MTSDAARILTLDALEHYSGPPLHVFIGIDSRGSAVHRLYPRWAEHVGLQTGLCGLNLPTDTAAGTWRRLAVALRDNPSIEGAVITSHKLRAYQAWQGVLDEVDVLVEATHEINAVDSRDGRLRGFARDAQSLDVLLHGRGAMAGADRPLFCIGAGGSAIALVLAKRVDIPASIATGQLSIGARGAAHELTVVGRSAESLAEMSTFVRRLGIPPQGVRTVRALTPADCAAALRQAPRASLVINATGLGKEGPGSPLPGPRAFPSESAAWDFNYRGPLSFLEQARSAGVPSEDGWRYFLAGWACALAALTDRDGYEVLEQLRSSSTHPSA